MLAVGFAVGQAVTVATGLGCPYGLILIDDDLYGIDINASALMQLGPDQPIGSLGFTVGDISGLFVDPVSGGLFMIATDLDTATNNLYRVDIETGVAALVAPYADHYTAFAVAGDSGFDTIFEDGFQ